MQLILHETHANQDRDDRDSQLADLISEHRHERQSKIEPPFKGQCPQDTDTRREKETQITLIRDEGS
ncbi:hypothetical protein JCM15831A_14230 [Asaia astilbis]